MNTYDKIETVLKLAGRALAPHEFDGVIIPDEDGGEPAARFGREFVGCSESTLGRRMREMVQDGRLTRRIREGKTFKEFALVVKEPVAADPAGAHSGGY